MSNELKVKVEGGYFRATVSEDPDYPGIDVEFVPNGYNGDLSVPRVLFEQPKDMKDIQCRALIWGDKDNEDFTSEVEWKKEDKKDK